VVNSSIVHSDNVLEMNSCIRSRPALPKHSDFGKKSLVMNEVRGKGSTRNSLVKNNT
jgi:hypothetical protein